MKFKFALFIISTSFVLLRSAEKTEIASAYDKVIELDSGRLKNTCPWSLLKRAIIKNDIEGFNFILDKYPEWIDFQGEPYGMTLLMIACLVENQNIVKILLSQNAQVGLLNYFKETAMIISLRKKNNEIIALLKNVDK